MREIPQALLPLFKVYDTRLNLSEIHVLSFFFRLKELSFSLSFLIEFKDNLPVFYVVFKILTQKYVGRGKRVLAFRNRKIKGAGENRPHPPFYMLSPVCFQKYRLFCIFYKNIRRPFLSMPLSRSRGSGARNRSEGRSPF